MPVTGVCSRECRQGNTRSATVMKSGASLAASSLSLSPPQWLSEQHSSASGRGEWLSVNPVTHHNTAKQSWPCYQRTCGLVLPAAATSSVKLEGAASRRRPFAAHEVRAAPVLSNERTGSQRRCARRRFCLESSGNRDVTLLQPSIRRRQGWWGQGLPSPVSCCPAPVLLTYHAPSAPQADADQSAGQETPPIP